MISRTHILSHLKRFVLVLLASGILAGCVMPAPGPAGTVLPSLPTAAPGEHSSVPSITATPLENTVPSDPLFWSIQTLTWGPNSEIYSPPLLDRENRLLVAYVDRNTGNLNLGIYSGETPTILPVTKSEKTTLYPSLAIDSTGGLRISYFDPDTSTIYYGQFLDSRWQIEKVAEDVRVSALTLVIHPQGRPVIVYSDTRVNRLRSIEKDAETWTIADIAPVTIGKTSLPALFGPDGQLRIVYNFTKQGLVYMQQREDGSWDTQVLEPPGVPGRLPAFAFGPDGAPHISYYDPAAKVLKHAVLISNEWKISVVENTSRAGKYSAIAVDRHNTVHISYFDEGKHSLQYIFDSGAGWTAQALGSLSAAETNTWLVLDSQGNPNILYLDSKDEALRFASIRLPGQEDGRRQRLFASHRFGQTFLTWEERLDLQNETYRVYRSAQPIRRPSDLPGAQLLGEVGEYSSRFYASYHDEGDHVTWKPRYTEYLVTADGQMPVPEHVGLLVWTISAEDLNGKTAGQGYYAVTVTPPGGEETLFSGYLAGPVAEKVEDPRPVDISRTPGVNSDPNRHVYIQYMDLRNWNATFHAPNSTNRYYGFPVSTPGIAKNLQYAYDYAVFTPSGEDCGGDIPQALPVNVYLHGYRGNRYGETTRNPFPYCAYTIIPIDVTETWYFGFARQHDFRKGGKIEAGDVIENYTEQRVLRMVYDLLKNSPAQQADEQRVYLFGHSMGGSGTLTLAERYPGVFAAAYSSQPITDYRTAGSTDKDWAADVAIKWGSQELNLPIAISAPANWAAHLQKYTGVGVWDWQNAIAGILRQRVDDMVPLGIDHGTGDSVITWNTQGKPFYSKLSASRQAWTGLVNGANHEWMNFTGLSPAMGNSDGILPFWNFTMVRDETVPGLSNLQPDPVRVEGKGLFYNHAVIWSSSWNPWDGSPIDQTGSWQMSFCAGKPGSTRCAGAASLKVDITPRRIQRFKVTPGAAYTWYNQEISTGAVLSSGIVTADEDGLITVEGFEIPPGGSRLVIEPAQ